MVKREVHTLSTIEEATVLSALRGPDKTEEQQFKGRFTCPIRCWVMGQTPEYLYTQLGWSWAGSAPDSVQGWVDLAKEVAKEQVSDPMSHYLDHVHRAINVIIVREKHNESRKHASEGEQDPPKQGGDVPSGA